MKFRLILLITCFAFSFNLLNAQNTYDINFPGNDRNEKCQECFQIFSRKPKEVKFSIKNDGNNLYFHVNDKNWFNLLFKNSGDGIALDVVAKDIFGCYELSVSNKQIKGELLPPVYAQKLKSGLRPFGDDGYRVLIGKVPSDLINKELEYNILFLNNKNLCQYYVIYNLESYPWDLLDMGMYLDSLTYNVKKIKPVSEDVYQLRNKTLKFKIPFEKNKSEYSQADIKPIYDSLRLTDYNIKSIKIKAYASVEGSLERNIELQQQRANSIVAALQTFQKPTIKTEVSSSENWVEFLNDIKNTKHANLSKLTKADVKSKLVGDLSKELEPILKNHRKALIELELEKKEKYNLSPDELMQKFNTEVSTGNVGAALEIQNSIFEKIKDKVVSPDFLKKMNVPKQEKFVKIFNKNSAYRYLLDVKQALIVYNELLALEKLAPKDAEVKYNIAAVKIKLWRFNAIEIDETKLKTQINALKNYGIHHTLISRMMVNFHIIKAENLMRKRDYTNKDKSVAFINSNYKNFPLSDYDYLSLAQFFSYYANIDMAVKLLEDKAKSIDIDEDLLFYYLNLTLINKELTQEDSYRTIMLNAYNLNNKRYCKLFNSVDNGGVTFQLLDDDYLRETYCENCVNQNP